MILALNKANNYRHSVDLFGSDLVQLMGDLKAATNFAEQTTHIWSPVTSAELGAAARGHAGRLSAEIKEMEATLGALRQKLSKPASAEIDASSVNGDLF